MNCERGKKGFCNPNSESPVLSSFDIKPGAYLKLYPCQLWAISQTIFHVNHQCTRSLLTNDVCDEECNSELFRYDNGTCEYETIAPTVTPTNQTNEYEETATPTVSPNPEEYEQTTIPTTSPIITPSLSPTNDKTATPTVYNETVTPTVYNETVTPTSSPAVAQEMNTGDGDDDLLWLLWLLLIIPIVGGIMYYRGACTGNEKTNETADHTPPPVHQ